MRKTLGLFVAVVTCFTAVAASAQQCTNVYSLTGRGRIKNIKYKPSNAHGGRGISFIVQEKAERGLVTREMRDTNCNLIGKLGLWREKLAHRFDTLYCPYGTRYYSLAPGGSKLTPTQVINKAKSKTGSGVILVQLKDRDGVTDRWVRVKNVKAAEGTVTTYPNANRPGGVCWRG